MFSSSVDAGFVLALPFQHGDLEPDSVGVSTKDKNAGRAYALGEGGGVFAGHYGMWQPQIEI